jgi:hypothetical protein
MIAKDILDYGFLAGLETTEHNITLLLGRNDTSIDDFQYYNEKMELLLRIELGEYSDVEHFFDDLTIDQNNNIIALIHSDECGRRQ